MVNVNMLKGKMKEKGETQETLANALNLSVKTVNNKLTTGKFKTNEFDIIADYLQLTNAEAVEIFLGKKFLSA